MYIIDSYTSFKIPTKSKNLVIINHPNDIAKLNLSIIDDFVVLGEGSNTFFSKDYNGTVLINKISSLEISDVGESVYITAGAGDNWHIFVSKVSSLGYHGLENLAYIPGTVGAAPIQNIGAYGVEVESFIDNIAVYDLVDRTIKQISHAECEFSYRDSRFKKIDWQQRYIIIAVTFVLSKKFSPNLNYKEIKRIFYSQICTPAKLLNAIVQIRKSKLPDHNKIPNAGSFFKNPIITKEQFINLQEKFQNVPSFKLNDTENVKIPAAWLIEQTNLKGYKYEGAAIYDKHALIIINYNNAKASDIIDLSNIIINKIKANFNINLETEVRII